MPRSALGHLSVLINEWTGGIAGESICGRLARRFGPQSLICHAIDAVLGEGHCRDELR